MVDVGTEKALEIPVQIDIEFASNCYMISDDQMYPSPPERRQQGDTRGGLTDLTAVVAGSAGRLPHSDCLVE